MGQRNITFVYPYYMNPGMLKLQEEIWSNYPEELRKRLEIIVIDDCSPSGAAIDVANKDIPVDYNLFQIEGEDIPWNWLAARNIGATHAQDNNFLLLTDIDHVVCEEVLTKLISQIDSGVISPDNLYMFERRDAPCLTPYKPHNDSFFLDKFLFWKSGGYDEEFSGLYGTAWMYRKRQKAVAEETIRLKEYLIRYTRDVIADASTTTLARKEGRDPKAKKRIKLKKRILGRKNKIRTLSFPYRKIF